MIGIKTNIELMLLPYEFFNKKNKTINMVIGKPIPYQNFDTTLNHNDWAQWVKKKVYELEFDDEKKVKNVLNHKFDSQSALSV